ncbi:hypothetical protein [Streptomyces sp. NRRL S-813]|uniref:hypothetical protein n=1 Tax=Streptomyces sp. NRRL S-813 TaxID=1463919 RepID=UPI0004BEFDC6|nr:hypothetical protein [Streptomyces sp. NRRL S-813]
MTDNHKADLDRVSTQNNYTDFTRTADDLPQGGGFLTRLVNGALRAAAQQSPYASVVSHSTDFGGTHLGLNQLLDMVEQTDPEDLESSGKALWDARDAIKSAAEELSGHIDHVHWVGESGDAFRKWGGTLVGKAHQLSDFAGGAGDQLTAAAVGLASVRGAMPARDTQANRKRPDQFTEAEKAADKDGYATAVQVEKDRQEAINQMNRLASYYAVSNEQLTAVRKNAPTFEAMPNVGVPKPRLARRRDVAGGASGPTIQGSGSSAAPSHTLAASTLRADAHGIADSMVPAQHVTEHTAPPDVPVGTPVGTNIDNVGTLPPPVTTPPAPHTPPATGMPVSDGGPTNVFGGGPGAPLPNGIPGRSPGGAGGFRNPVSAQGRTGVSGPAAQSSGRSLARGAMNQMGRATSAGQSIGRATPTGAKASTPPGRAVTGGTPRVGGSAAPRATGSPTTGAGRANGVVGGRPTASPGASAKGGGSRLPRGTVIGAEETTGSRSASGRTTARGVVGTPESTQRPGTGAGASASRGRAGGTGAEDISGRPATRNSVARAERNGMTRGGAGLVRGSGSHRQDDDGRKAERAPRPDHGDDEENERHLPTQPRRDVPPVIN